MDDFVFREARMNPATDVLYQVHQFQAERRGQPALSRGEFRARLPATYETDLTGLLAPRPGLTIRTKVMEEPKFKLGRVCITPHAAQAVPAVEVLTALARHTVGDWGALDAHDRQENERALSQGGRLVSVYETSTGQKFWVITEANFAQTTVLLPEDY
jgi:hypothetical protein